MVEHDKGTGYNLQGQASTQTLILGWGHFTHSSTVLRLLRAKITIAEPLETLLLTLTCYPIVQASAGCMLYRNLFLFSSQDKSSMTPKCMSIAA